MIHILNKILISSEFNVYTYNYINIIWSYSGTIERFIKSTDKI